MCGIAGILTKSQISEGDKISLKKISTFIDEIVKQLDIIFNLFVTSVQRYLAYEEAELCG